MNRAIAQKVRKKMNKQSQHTPAPWTIESDTHLIRGADDSLVAKVTPFDRGEGKANARLIAAAPALLEALDALLDAYGNDVCTCVDPHEPGHCPCCIARTALAQAR